MQPARLPLSRSEWACLVFACAAGLGFLAHELRYPSAWDAAQYLDMGRDIAARGLFAKVQGSEMRTYGYPWLASLVLRTSAAVGIPFTIALFVLQFVAYVAAVACLRSALAPAGPRAARIAFCGLLVNVYVLVYTPQSLTESVSLSLLVFTAACWVLQWQAGLSSRASLAGSLAAGFALVVRPANLFVVATWVFGLALLWVRQRPRGARGAALLAIAIAGFAVPMAPQLAINAVHYGKTTPFVAADLGLLQQILGIRYLKYATALPPVPEAPIPYENPLLRSTTFDETAPLRWYLEHPGRGLATIALHTFNLTDQDLLFTYSRDLRPWYRIPSGIVNHAAVALGVVGLVLAARRIRASRDRRARDALLVLLALLAANWAVYAWTAVEMRFGAVLLLVLFPFGGYALSEIARQGARRRRAVALCTGLYVVAALALSGWVREQSPLIRNAPVAAAAEMFRYLNSCGVGDG